MEHRQGHQIRCRRISKSRGRDVFLCFFGPSVEIRTRSSMRYAQLLSANYCDTRGLEFVLEVKKKKQDRTNVLSCFLVRVSRFELEAVCALRNCFRPIIVIQEASSSLGIPK